MTYSTMLEISPSTAVGTRGSLGTAGGNMVRKCSKFNITQTKMRMTKMVFRHDLHELKSCILKISCLCSSGKAIKYVTGDINK